MGKDCGEHLPLKKQNLSQEGKSYSRRFSKFTTTTTPVLSSLLPPHALVLILSRKEKLGSYSCKILIRSLSIPVPLTNNTHGRPNEEEKEA
jgi:hypothetical protein